MNRKGNHFRRSEHVELMKSSHEKYNLPGFFDSATCVTLRLTLFCSQKCLISLQCLFSSSETELYFMLPGIFHLRVNFI